jgi:hypothetical protein
VYSATGRSAWTSAADRRPARLAEQQRRLRIDVDEDLLDRRLVRLIGGDHLTDAGEQRLDTFGQALLVVRLDAAAGHIDQLLAHAVR